MKIKKVKVGIRDVRTALDEFVDAGKAIQQRQKVKKETGVYFTSIEAFRKALTPKRMEVLHAIRTQKPDSIHVLSRILKRDIKNIAMDVQYLTQVGLVEKRRSKTKSSEITPLVNYEKIIFEISV